MLAYVHCERLSPAATIEVFEVGMLCLYSLLILWRMWLCALFISSSHGLGVMNWYFGYSYASQSRPTTSHLITHPLPCFVRPFSPTSHGSVSLVSRLSRPVPCLRSTRNFYCMVESREPLCRCQSRGAVPLVKNVCFLHFVRELLHGVCWAGCWCGKADGRRAEVGPRGRCSARGGEGEYKNPR